MVRRAGLLAAMAVMLAGCANQSPLVDRMSKGQVQGDANHVSIEGGRLDALPLAVMHCSRFGRSAQWSHAEDGRSVYDCVAKP